jgi:hypothetical protein
VRVGVGVGVGAGDCVGLGPGGGPLDPVGGVVLPAPGIGEVGLATTTTGTDLLAAPMRAVTMVRPGDLAVSRPDCVITAIAVLRVSH